MKLGTQHHLVYFIVLKWLESKKIVICLKVRAMFFFEILYETRHTIKLVICYCDEMVKIENNKHMLESTC